MAHLINYNPILDSDSYKYSHHKQYPAERGFISSYIESRGGRFDRTVFAGLQILLMNWEANPISMDMIDDAESYILDHGLPFNREGWEIIVDELGGRMPIRIQAVPEGQIVPTKNVLVQIINTDDRFLWLVSFIETAILRAVWYPTTVATVSKETVDVIRKFHEETADDLGAVMHSLHDFGSRGATSRESAGIGGVAHLFNSTGTDTVEALRYARVFYGAHMGGKSLPAAEHSTATSWGRLGQANFVRRMVRAYDTPYVSIVSDSYDIFEMVRNTYCRTLIDEIKSSGKTIVIRPDSGDPVEVLKEIFTILHQELSEEIIVNSKGYMMLPGYFRIIQGDGVNTQSITDILSMMKDRKWSAANIVFGMGGKLLQDVNRDTQRFAMKASAAQFNDDPWMDIFKDPKTDPGKASKKGRLALIYDGEDQLITVPERQTFRYPKLNLLKDVFVDGKVVLKYTLEEARARVARNW